MSALFYGMGKTGEDPLSFLNAVYVYQLASNSPEALSLILTAAVLNSRGFAATFVKDRQFVKFRRVCAGLINNCRFNNKT